MKTILLCLLSFLLSAGTILYTADTLEVYYGNLQEENECGHPGAEKLPYTEKLASLHKYVHFSDEFTETQYFIEHHDLASEGFTSIVYLPPEA